MNLRTITRYIVLPIGAYLGSIITKHILDKYITRFRIDKWILFLLFVKTPYIKTKVIFTSKKRPDMLEVRGFIQNQFELDRNEVLGKNKYIFKVRGHPTPMKVSLREPSETGDFTVVLETVGEDKLDKIFMINNSFKETIHIFEKISNHLKKLELKSITARISIEDYFSKDDLKYYSRDNILLGSKSIKVSTKEFSTVNSLVKECIRKWIVLLL